MVSNFSDQLTLYLISKIQILSIIIPAYALKHAQPIGTSSMSSTITQAWRATINRKRLLPCTACTRLASISKALLSLLKKRSGET